MPIQPENSQPLENLIKEKVTEIATQAYNLGYKNGLETGKVIGYVEGVNALKPALSDGLRHGSSECGKAMQGLRSIGAYNQEEDEEEVLWEYEPGEDS